MKTEDAPESLGAVSARKFAERLGLSVFMVVKLCRRGRIEGAQLHPLTRKWWIHPPAKLLFP